MITQTAARGGATAAGSPSVAAAGPAAPWRDRVLTGVGVYAGYVVLQVLQLFVLSRLAPRFFWYDDAQAQFGPMTWWLGRHMEGGRPPLMDPEQGQAGNLVADMQYGALDPLHWGLQALAARTDDVVLMSWVFATLSVLLLGLGLLTLLRHHGVHPAIALAGALGTASSGFLLWYGSAWWPLLWSVAWLPWFWWGLVSRRTVGVVVLAVSTWALLASGNPYILFFALALVLAHAVELVRDARSLRGLLAGPVVARLLAMSAGLAMALPTLLSTVQMSPYIERQEADPLVGNVGFAVPNLADVVLGSPTLMGQTNAWSGSLSLAPAMYTFLVAVAALALVDWRRALRSPGVLTAAAVLVLAVVFTQLPTTVAVFRYPVRYLVVVQVVLPVLVLLALTAAPLLTRPRLALAAGLIGVQALLAAFRAPVFFRWHALAAVLTVVAVAALVLALGRAAGPRGDRGRRVAGAAAVVLVLSAWGTVFVGEQMMVSLSDRADVLDARPDLGDTPFRVFGSYDPTGSTVQDYRRQLVATDSAATVITPGFGGDFGWGAGVIRGNGNLLGDFATGTGSFAVWQLAQNAHWCRNYQGATCGDPQLLLAEAPGVGVPWIDLLSSDRVLISDAAPEPLRAHFEQPGWTLVRQAGVFREYQREDGLPGRVTAARGADVAEVPGGVGLGRGDGPMDSYTVSTGGSAGQLALRTTWWPGMEATVDGQSIPVGTVDGAVLRLDLPAGLDGARLEISYVPIGERILVPSFVVAGVLLVAALAVWVLTDRRGPRGAAGRRHRAPAEVAA
ncbi:hypothetical protein GCU67_18080 [Modestobacter muralis]|uniref:YfhO family protein n=1 Tax=Modestobacter muralis TaxID=1608614 RepID=A0A6P0EXY8_9ACTN|nr:hypothetical protein [Modestobacter muralis]NEK96057.1 hypothetical protein [Modestobacter muralis]NEN52945.1 hypothetical protein [Modestobacter muralis]